jgi:hypothetical protein
MKELFKELRNNLEPFNSDWKKREDYDVVKMGIHSNAGYMNGKTVRDAIDDFEKRFKIVSTGLDEFNCLEKIGIILLFESAHIVEQLYKKEDKNEHS